MRKQGNGVAAKLKNAKEEREKTRKAGCVDSYSCQFVHLLIHRHSRIQVDDEPEEHASVKKEESSSSSRKKPVM